MDIKELTNNLRRIDIEPSKKWQDDTLNMLKLNTQLDINTNKQVLFKFLNYNLMGTIIAVISAILLAAGGTAYAADSSNPGDLLYPVDKFMEQVQRGLTFNYQAKVQFELKLMNERVSELEAVQARVSNQGEEKAIKASIGEMEAQQLRLQEALQAMNQYASENDEANNFQYQFMYEFGGEIDGLLQKMEQVRAQLQDGSNEGVLFQFQHSFQKSMQEGIDSSNTEEPVQLQFQFQNQEQTENKGTDNQLMITNQFENANGVNNTESNSQQNANQGN